MNRAPKARLKTMTIGAGHSLRIRVAGFPAPEITLKLNRVGHQTRVGVPADHFPYLERVRPGKKGELDAPALHGPICPH